MQANFNATADSNAALENDANLGGGNAQLTQAFDRAIEQAQETLATTTIKGADLYSLKQSAR